MEKVICRDCGKVIEKDDTRYGVDDYECICEECFNQNYFECEDCGRIIHCEDSYYIEDEDKRVCDYCIDQYYHCEDCGNYVNNATYIQDYGNVCENCYNSGDYGFCEECGDYYRMDDLYYNNHSDSYYCENCYHDIDNLLYSYHDFSDWQLFKGQNEENPPYYIGKEIELEPKQKEKLRDVVNAMNNNLNAVGMEDGSLNYGSIEVVTHPESWQYLQENKNKYIKFFEEMNKYNYGDNGHTGLHFHVTRPNEEVISRIIVIIESFKDEIKKLSRRNGDFHWSRFITDNGESEVENIKYKSTKYLKDNYIKDYHDRYLALNLNNKKTIEFRFFKGVNNFEQFWSGLQFIHNIMEVALDENKDLNTINWKDLLIGEELQAQAQKQDVLNVDKFAKDTTQILEKIEKAKEETKKEIKKTLNNFIKYISREMEGKQLELLNKNDVYEIVKNGRDFIDNLSNDLSYLQRLSNLYNDVDECSLNSTKYNISYLKDCYYSKNKYSRYFKQLENAIKKYENEVYE